MLLLVLGIDTRLSAGEHSLASNYSSLQIYKALVQTYKVPSFHKSENVIEFLGASNIRDDPDLVYNARKTIYAISRARVQYIGACIPLFRFKHSLFEALVCSIHWNDINPSIGDQEKIVSTAHLISQKNK